jgi:hypothetical protein
MSVRSAYSRGPCKDASSRGSYLLIDRVRCVETRGGKKQSILNARRGSACQPAKQNGCWGTGLSPLASLSAHEAQYSGKENESMEQTIETQIANLVGLIKSKYISEAATYRPVDLAQKLQYFTLDVISDLAFGQPLGYLEQDADPYDYIEAMGASMPVLATLGNVPWLADLFHSRLLRRFLPSERDEGGFGALIGCVLPCKQCSGV